MKKRLLTALLCLCLVFAMIPSAAMAEDSNIWDGTVAAGFDGGTGTETDPYLISNGAELAYLAQTVNSGTGYSGEYFKLTSDIVLNDTTDWEIWNQDTANLNKWTPIGKGYSTSFAGTFDGSGYAVSGLYINITTAVRNYIGLFSYSTGTIQNLEVRESYIYGKYTGGLGSSISVGSITGFNGGNIINCCNSGSVIAVTGDSGSAGGGGITGGNNGSITNCSNSGNVTATAAHTAWAGGLTDYNNSDDAVSNCFNSGKITASGSVESYSGGLAGINVAGNGSFNNCYNAGNVTAAGSDINLGGLVGLTRSPLISCYYLKTDTINSGLNAVKDDRDYINYCDTFSGPAEPDADVSYQGSTDKIPLLTALNNWVDSQDGTTAYNSWAADSSINSGYPFFGYIVSNDLPGLTSSGSDGIPLSISAPMDDYTAVLTADDGYMLPDSITVKVDDTELDPTTEYTYDNTTGQLTINGASITGNIEIIAVGIEKIYTITADPAALDFGSADAGYSALTAKTVKITNTGNTDIIVDLPADTDHFTIEAGNGFSDSKANIAAGETASFAVTPKTGLAAGTYDDTITIEADHETSAAVTAGFTVTKAESGASSTGTDTQSGTSVKTGVTDNTGMTIVIVLILCAAVGGIVYVYRRRKSE